jgi:hypothetical protein
MRDAIVMRAVGAVRFLERAKAVLNRIAAAVCDLPKGETRLIGRIIKGWRQVCREGRIFR